MPIILMEEFIMISKVNAISAQPIGYYQVGIQEKREPSFPQPTNQAVSDSNESVQLILSPEAQKLLKKSTPENPDTSKIASNNTGTAQKQPSKTATSKEQQLSEEEQKIVKQLQARDLHVKMHEQQHLSAAGAFAVGGPTYHYQTGPDGKAYAIGGEVHLDVSEVPNNPEATIAKAQTLRQAALAPADPSGADRSIAAAASQMEAKARAELLQKNQKEAQLQMKGNDPIQASTSDKERHAIIQMYKNAANFQTPGGIIDKIA